MNKKKGFIIANTNYQNNLPLNNNIIDKFFKKKNLSSNHEKNNDFTIENTNYLCMKLEKKLESTVIPFHLHLPNTYNEFLENLKKNGVEDWTIIPSFAQFSYPCTGSIANFFKNNLPKEIIYKLRWIKSYAGHREYIYAYYQKLQRFLIKNKLSERDCIFIFVAPKISNSFLLENDIFKFEYEITFQEILKNFPFILGKLLYEEVSFPLLSESLENIDYWRQKRNNIIFIPLGNISDTDDTSVCLKKYKPFIKIKDLELFCCPALNLSDYWINGLIKILEDKNFSSNQMLTFIRPE